MDLTDMPYTVSRSSASNIWLNIKKSTNVSIWFFVYDTNVCNLVNSMFCLGECGHPN